jgi:hypothetical protein
VQGGGLACSVDGVAACSVVECLRRGGVLASCRSGCRDVYGRQKKGPRRHAGRAATVRRRRGEGAEAFMSGNAEKIQQRAGMAAVRGWGRRAWDGGGVGGSEARQRGASEAAKRAWVESAWNGGGVDPLVEKRPSIPVAATGTNKA